MFKLPKIVRQIETSRLLCLEEQSVDLHELSSNEGDDLRREFLSLPVCAGRKVTLDTFALQFAVAKRSPADFIACPDGAMMRVGTNKKSRDVFWDHFGHLRNGSVWHASDYKKAGKCPGNAKKFLGYSVRLRSVECMESCLTAPVTCTGLAGGRRSDSGCKGKTVARPEHRFGRVVPRRGRDTAGAEEEQNGRQKDAEP
jgi:hypothetical protein